MPKSLALQHSGDHGAVDRRPMQLPLEDAAVHLGAQRHRVPVLRLLGIKPSPPITPAHGGRVEDLVMPAARGSLTRRARILQRVFRFGEVMTRQAMLHRTQMKASR